MPDPRFLNPITILADVGGVSIDILKRRTETYEHIISENPIEDGSPITDHVTNKPPRISLEGGFSDMRISNLLGPAVTQDAVKGRAKTEFDKLLDLFASRESFQVMDGLHLFKDMQFKTLVETKEKEGFSVMFTAEIWNIRKISLSTSPGDSLSSVTDSLDRLKLAPQLLLSVGAISSKDSLESLGVLA